MSVAMPSDEVVDYRKFGKGRDKWYAGGYHLSHGNNAENFFGMDLPWGDPEMDYFLKVQGHAQ